MSESVAPSSPAQAANAAPPSWWQRQDLAVVAAAAVLYLAGAGLHHQLTDPGIASFSEQGLRLERPAGLLPPVEGERPPAAFAGLGQAAEATARGPSFHKVYQVPGSPLARIEILIDRRPLYRGVSVSRQLARQTRYGELYWTAETAEREIAGDTWHRAAFRYAAKATESDAPRIATGIEYARVKGDRLYVVTLHGTPSEADWLDTIVAPSLRTGT